MNRPVPRIFLGVLILLLFSVAIAWGRSPGQTIAVPYHLADGIRLTGYLTLPPDYQAGKKYPAILLIHGGGGDSGGFRNRAKEFLQLKPVQKYLCGKYVVFSAAFHSDYLGGPREMESMAQALKTMAGLPQVAPGRIAALGVSHGGYLALRCAAQPQMQVQIKAAVSISGVTDVAAFLRDRCRSSFGSRAEKGPLPPALAASPVVQALGWPPERDARTRANYNRLSVLTHLDNLLAPVLLIHGARDNLVPVSQARKLRESLEKRRKVFEYLEVPTRKIGGHFIILTSSKIWEKIDAFLKKHL